MTTAKERTAKILLTRRLRPTRLLVLGSVLLAGLVLTGCASQPGSAPGDQAADTVHRLGSVPVPSAEPGPPAPVPASIGNPQLLAMGAPLRVSLPGGVDALITTSGPAEDLAPVHTPDDPVPGVITITAIPSAGSVQLSAADLSSRDEHGTDIPLTPVGPATVTAAAGQPAILRVSGLFHDGQAQINWQQGGHVVGMWDFSIEND